MGKRKLVILRKWVWAWIGLLLLCLPNFHQAAESKTILVLGDSLSAGYGLPQNTGWVSLLAKKLQQLPEKTPHRTPHHANADYNVINASISGETTQGGRNRLAALLQQHQPQILILALGANDGLRGFPLSSTRDNLSAMTQLAQRQHTKVLLIGVQLPPNYGKRYTDELKNLYTQLAKQQHTALVPTIFSGLSDDGLNYFQEDRLHPNQRAQERILTTIWEKLQPLL